jgi:2-keto-4-pentenoate hydratase/2-oxohepta-3-ene-1,7-dioic acid hydratase in catechol pathway
MKLITYMKQGEAAVGIVTHQGVVDVVSSVKVAGFSGDFSSIRGILTDPAGLAKLKKLVDWVKENEWKDYIDIKTIDLCAPVPNPEKILGAALNYYDACTRGKVPVPKVLMAFGKFSTTINSPGGGIDLCGHDVSYEGELGVVIGRKCKKVSAEDALEYIAGYTAVNDITANDCTSIDIQLLRGKNYEGFFPMGPVMVTADEIGNVSDLHITTTLNGEMVQDSRTSQLIVDIPHLVEYFSSFLTLVPGDVIATGTPAGIAVHFNPPKFMKSKDIVEVTIEKIGTLQSKIL